MLFAAISDSGVIRDQTEANETAGARIWEMVVGEGARGVVALRDDPRAVIQQAWRLV